MSLEHLWAGWRSDYVSSGASRAAGCVFCNLLSSDAPDSETNVVWRNESVAVLLNAYPYGTGHALVLPLSHKSDIGDLDAVESQALWKAVNDCALAVRSAYDPNGMNIGFNLGEGSGAGVPGHLHAHVLPRWKSDTNFMTTVANTKVLPEALDVTWKKLRDAWPS